MYFLIYILCKREDWNNKQWLVMKIIYMYNWREHRPKQPKVIGSKNSKKNLHVLLKGDLYYLICILCAQEDSNKKQQLVLKIIYIRITGKQIHQYSIFSLCAWKEWCQQAGSGEHLQYIQKNSLSICTQKDSNNQWWLVPKIIYMYEHIYIWKKTIEMCTQKDWNNKRWLILKITYCMYEYIYLKEKYVNVYTERLNQQKTFGSENHLHVWANFITKRKVYKCIHTKN